jgi:hypothetical protein
MARLCEEMGLENGLTYNQNDKPVPTIIHSSCTPVPTIAARPVRLRSRKQKSGRSSSRGLSTYDTTCASTAHNETGGHHREKLPIIYTSLVNPYSIQRKLELCTSKPKTQDQQHQNLPTAVSPSQAPAGRQMNCV